MKKYKLQIKLTAIVGLILLISCLLLTINSLFSAHSYYGDYMILLENGMIEYDSALPEGTIPPAINPNIYYQDASQKFSVQSIVVMALIVTLALVFTYFVTGYILKPLKELTQSVKYIDDQHLDKRIDLNKQQGEVLSLTEAFNHMLERMEAAFLIQKSFASNAAHELKTPLAVIKSSLQVLEMTPNPEVEDYQEFMYDTGQSLERIIKTVDSLLSLANFNDVNIDETIELQTLIEQVIQEFASQSQAFGIKISIFAEKNITVYGNYNLLYRLFYNLIENAIKYNCIDGTIKIELNQNKNNVYIEVSDTGIGMSEETLNHIFEPFYRADKSRSQNISGSGLGLAIVKLILEQHGGKIHVASEVGNGSTFLVTLNTINI